MDTLNEKSMPDTPIPESSTPVPGISEGQIKIDLSNIKVTEAEKELFFKSFLSDQPYEQSMEIFGGKFPIKFKALSVEENGHVLRQISIDQMLGLAVGDSSYFFKITLYRLALSISEINHNPFLPDITLAQFPFDDKKGTSFITERIKSLNSWGIFKLGGIQEEFRKFENKILKMTKELDNPDFWKAAV